MDLHPRNLSESSTSSVSDGALERKVQEDSAVEKAQKRKRTSRSDSSRSGSDAELTKLRKAGSGSDGDVESGSDDETLSTPRSGEKRTATRGGGERH